MANNTLLLIGEMAAVLGTALLVAAALHDVAARTIPNWMSLCLLMLGVVLRCLDASLIAGLSLGLLVFAIAVFCWKRRWVGGGDVKLITAAAIFVPPGNVGDLLVATTLCGGVVGLIYLFARLLSKRQRPAPSPRPPGRLARILRVERRRLSRGGPLPYASAIAAGTIFVIFAG
jgi:prepilin peptidase CpaA